ncbi:hypothetical protein DdX_12641 [Ditylenchus destructor]|uniref:Uncharacterized protein n=1 Tax=Ditylenchus destructor TaxID=166010 RepID=A0AAD4MU71_9BILA|nr:hypothetical protein DdX_12641 [Ditylenchus destructor]
MTQIYPKKPLFSIFATLAFVQIGCIEPSDVISRGTLHSSPYAEWISKASEETEHLSNSSTLIDRKQVESNSIPEEDSRPPLEYKTQEEVCPKFEGRELMCNEHLLQGKRCVCGGQKGHKAQIQDSDSEVCHPSTFQVQEHRIEDYILTIGIGFPIPGPFLLDPDAVFAEDLELFAFIPMKSVVIFGKGCNVRRKTFEFQFGLLKETKSDGTRNYISDQLRTLSPEIFMQNPLFIHENGLIIEYVEKAQHLTSLPKNSALIENSEELKSLETSTTPGHNTYWIAIPLVLLLAAVLLVFFGIRWFIRRKSNYYSRISKESGEIFHC